MRIRILQYFYWQIDLKVILDSIKIVENQKIESLTKCKWWILKTHNVKS
ncbi:MULTISPECIES: hypothetical protein [Helicobacter]|nr:hypothetical protein [Helicobacter sp. MIT 03-1616]